jgi:hypothetical protein
MRSVAGARHGARQKLRNAGEGSLVNQPDISGAPRQSAVICMPSQPIAEEFTTGM